MTSSRPIYLTNTMGRRLEEFRPVTADEVTIYTCGPTVYSYQHIGNFRAFIFADTLRRMLEYNGYAVRQARNITDVGHLTEDTIGAGVDKMEAAARRENMRPEDIAEHYTDIFWRDAKKLNLREPTYQPRATEYIQPMIALVERLIERGHAYSSNGNVYYAVDTFPDYGRLSGNSVEELIAGHRVEVGEDKRSPADFALWKEAEPDKLMRYESPWGMGVPGWHLECSAMAMDLLGAHIDIHTGGEDHIFPHHEDEIAQSEGATGETFAGYWMHNAFLQLSAEKMSKSLGNIYTISDLEERGIPALAWRYFNFQAHYRTPLTFSWEALEAAQTALQRIWEAAAELVQSAQSEELGSIATGLRDRFHAAVNQDLDLPGALAVLHEVLGTQLPPGQKLTLLEDFDRVLALDMVPMGRRLSETTSAQEKLIAARAEARAARDWARSDALRSELTALGLEVRDTPAGQRWVRKDLLSGDGHQASHATGNQAESEADARP